MTIKSFDTLCASVCEAAGCDVPPKATNGAGRSAVAFTLNGVEVMLAHDAARCADAALVLTRFGSLPLGQELPSCIALLQANSTMLAPGSPSFGCDPVTGDILLQHAVQLDRASGAAVYQSIVRFVEIAIGWQASPLLPMHESEPAASLPDFA